jgi:large subunit ribosomal protein L24
MKIKKGDTVQVIAGKDKGKQAKVLLVDTERRRVVVEGVGIVKRHMKRQGTTPGQIVEVEKSIDVSNVAAIDPASKKPTRVGYAFEGGKKVRVAKKSGKQI